MFCANPEAGPRTTTMPGPSLNLGGEASIVLLCFSQVSMNKMNGDRSFSDSGRNALDVACPDVAYREHSRQTRFQHLRRAGQGPCGGAGNLIQIAPCENKTLVVESDASLQPIGSRRRASHDEHVTNRVFGSLACRFVAPRHGFHVTLAAKADDFRLEVQIDVRILL